MWLLACAAAARQPAGGTVRGRVVDPSGALVGGVSVAVVGAGGAERKIETNQEGAFVINGLAAGTYSVRAAAQGFAPYEKTGVEVSAGKTTSLEIALAVTVAGEVTVGSEPPLSADPESNASATVLREPDIKALPSDPAELAAALQALAGPAAGPSGGEIFIDGFSGGKLPPRDTIREIRINQNPFSSEYDRLGLGRIEILTRPGTDEWNGEAGGEFEDESLNSRNPFAANRPPFQLRNLSVDLSGPLVKKRASFFVDFERENIDNNALVNALVLDPNLNVTPLRRAVLAPSKNIEFSPRVDVRLSGNQTLVGRYFFARSGTENAGLGGFDLPSRAFAARDDEHTLRLTETAVISSAIVNEARFQYIRRRAAQEGSDDAPTIRVLEAFTSGGANVGLASADEDRFELHDNASFARGKHSLKAGGRLRHYRISDSSPNNFAGTFTFTSLDQYRETILNTPGAFPAQFSIAGGEPRAAVGQTDVGLFVQDDWRVKPQLTLSAGLRYESQTNISDRANFAPRVSFAYAPGAGGGDKPKTVFRGGFGVFYERFGESLTLQASRFDGTRQRQFVVTDPAILDAVAFTRDGGVSNVPTVESLEAFAQPQTTRVVAPDLRSPYTTQTTVSVERQLPLKTTLSVTYVNARTRRMLRSRNVNAPLGGVRPVAGAGNIFQYESTGRFDQSQLLFNARSNFSERGSIFANYAFGRARSDSDGAGTFPANSYDLGGEYGRAALDIRHRFVIGGSYAAPLGLRLSPFITFRSGVPFNITTGADANGDTLFTERPAFATSLSEPGIIVTRFGAFDPTPEVGDVLVPRNYGRGPEFFVVNLRAAKEFGFGGGGKKSSATPGQSGGGGGQRGGDTDDEESPYKLEFSVQVRNLFNHPNGGTPVGNLRSLFFGDPVSLGGGFGFGGGGGQAAGNRRIRFEVQFSF
jgi:hypothetical protein